MLFRSLASNFNAYTVLEQIDYPVNINPNNKTTVEVSDISHLRCDGVIEYSYEFNDVVMYGGFYWDISAWGKSFYDKHRIIEITHMNKQQII